MPYSIQTNVDVDDSSSNDHYAAYACEAQTSNSYNHRRSQNFPHPFNDLKRAALPRACASKSELNSGLSHSFRSNENLRQEADFSAGRIKNGTLIKMH